MTLDVSALAARLEDLERRHGDMERRYESSLREIRRLKDIEAITHLKHTYWRAIDLDDMPLLTGLLTEDFHCELGTDKFEYSAASRDQFIQMINKMNTDARASAVYICHQGHHPEITIDQAGERATGIWYLQDIGLDLKTDWLGAGTCFYHDDYVRTDAGWKLSASRWEWEFHMEIRHQMQFATSYDAQYIRGRHK